GIPFPDNHFDVVYHSHLLEHLSKTDAPAFIEECYRVLKPDGVIRMAVPDLERIVRTYLEQLELALRGNEEASLNYEWIMLEMYDQPVRNYSGGEMGKLYAQGYAANADFIYQRVGIRLTKENETKGNAVTSATLSISRKDAAKKLIRRCLALPSLIAVRDSLLKLILMRHYRFYEVGKFRLSGEIHQWMYDRFSLSRLLNNSNFKQVQVCTPWESRIPNWTSFHLDTNQDGTVYKPDSIYIEATK
ncbi:MAG: methyltransferase domain-containing protein, partial [Methanotrichaceae archaeon]|nr:methyltransferase domain-containing protein [Methanotrichaceae archaeon]